MKYQYREKIVAFVDILGFKRLVTDESKVEDIGAILGLPYMLRQGDMPKTLRSTGVMMTSISDSLVFSISPKERGTMNKITRLLSVLTLMLLSQYGLLLRGGIAVGKLYHDDNVVFRPGLVKAHELESQISIYPRIVMDTSDFERSIQSCTSVSQAILREHFGADDDGFLTLDCFAYAGEEILEACRTNLENMNPSDLRAQQKINWMKARIAQKLYTV